MSADAPLIFDNHQHVGGLFGIAEASATDVAENRDAFAADCATRLAAMDDAGVTQALLMPAHSYDRRHGIADTRTINDNLLAYRALAPDRFPVLIGTVEPRHGDAGLAEIDRLHGLGFAGLSWHHRFHGLPMDHPIMHGFLKRMADLSMVPLIHCFSGADYEELWRLRHLAEARPDMPILCLDSMTSATQFEEALVVAERVPNILFDLGSSVVGAAGLERLVDRIGPERILFGTNLYSGARPAHVEERAIVRDADIGDAARRMILHGNAARLYGLR